MSFLAQVFASWDQNISVRILFASGSLSVCTSVVAFTFTIPSLLSSSPPSLSPSPSLLPSPLCLALCLTLYVLRPFTLPFLPLSSLFAFHLTLYSFLLSLLSHTCLLPLLVSGGILEHLAGVPPATVALPFHTQKSGTQGIDSWM